MDRNIDISKFAPVGTKDCQSMCKRVPIRDRRGTKIVCLACERIVMEIKK
jgi:hypothetical protein